MWRNDGDYVKSWGATLIRGVASNAEFMVITHCVNTGELGFPSHPCVIVNIKLHLK